MVTACRPASPTGCPKLWTLCLDDSEQQPRADVFNRHAQIYFPTQNLACQVKAHLSHVSIW